MSSDDRRAILEHFDDKFAILLENIEVIVDKRVRPIVQEELAEVKTDIKIIKTAVKATNEDVADLRMRVERLEATAA